MHYTGIVLLVVNYLYSSSFLQCQTFCLWWFPCWT